MFTFKIMLCSEKKNLVFPDRFLILRMESADSQKAERELFH